MKKLHCFLLLLLLASRSIAQTDSLPSFVRDSLDTYVNRALAEWQIPGAAVGVVKNGNVVWMKGYGLRQLGSTDRVDENTLFMIGSNTKAFTATALALLDAEKKISLDDKVQKWLPDFTLYDPWVAKEAIVRDLLCHRLGFETFQGDFMYFDSDLSAAEVREKMGKLKPLYGFRSQWGYTNSAFLTAGEIIPKVTDSSWAQFVTARLFRPLGMDRSLALSKDISTAINRSLPHTVVSGKLQQVAYGKLDNMAPAGGISSSVRDLTHWVMMQLDNGKYEGKQIVPSSAIAQTRWPHAILGNGGTLFNRGHFSLYGLGWMLSEYNNRKVVAHTGGVNGFVTSITLIPEEKLGIIVLTNTDANGFYEALKWEIMDAYLHLPYRNYSNIYLARTQENEKQEEQAFQLMRDTVALHLPTTLTLPQYAGTYTHEVYGNMTIAINGATLEVRFQHHNGLIATLESIGGDRFLASFNNPIYGRNVWVFHTEKGKLKSVTVRVADFVEFTPYEFYKK